MVNFSRILIFILFSAASCLAQTQTISLTGGTVFRTGYFISPLEELPFKFKFLGANTEINGGINSAGGLNRTEIDGNCCFYGRRLTIRDSATGRNNFQQTSKPIIVNGVAYNTVYFSGEVTFKGGTVVPFYLKKKLTHVLNSRSRPKVF